jgi:hypothetical protein
MAITKIQSESLNLSDNYDFTGTVTGAGGANTPAFQAKISSDQNISSATNTKVSFDTEVFDTAGAYDHITNYRFTPQTAGKYYVYLNLGVNGGGATNLKAAHANIFKNGSLVNKHHSNYQNSNVYYDTQAASVIIDMNGSSDYIEAYGEALVNSGTPNFQSNNYSIFGAYKIIT